MNSKFTSAVKISIVAAILIVAAKSSNAQTQVSEGFDFSYAGTTFPNFFMPFGWGSGPMGGATDANNTWERVNAANGTNPACAPRGGSLAMLRYRSFYCNNVEQSNLTSRAFDLSQRPPGVPSNVRFWMYRDPTAQNDNIQVRVHSNPDPSAAGYATLVDTATFLTTINRPCASTPPAGPPFPPALACTVCSGWNLYAFTIPATTWSLSSVYISLIAQNGGAAGANIYIDDFSIETYPAVQTYTPGNISLVNQNVALVAKGSNNNWIIGMKVTVSGALTPITPGAFTFSPNGCTNPNPGADITMTKLWFTGGNNAFPTDAAGQPQNGILTASVNPAWPVATWSLTPGVGGTAVQLYNGDNYFWLSYDVPLGAVSNDFVDADFISAVINATTYTCGVAGCTMTGGRLIDVAYCVPSYTAGTSWLNGSYTDNDYVKTVYITNPGGTDPLFVPFYNDHNDVGPTTVGAGYPADPCVTSPSFINGGLSPFSVHPPDYQKFPTATVPNLCSAGNCVRTASFLETTVSPPVYNINVGCGTWFGSNYIAAFIDLNHDGDFSDPQEKIFQSTSMIKLTFQNANFTIPTTYGYFGNTTMRVREWYAQPNIDGCSGGYYGETEDYQITLRPDCLPAGWKVWLGYTDDWNVNSNWCGGVPTINDNALVARSGSHVGTYHPVIKTGVLATTRKLRIVGDTVEINAPTPGSLRISDSLSIGTVGVQNTSAVIVDSQYVNSANLLNGVNTSTVYVAFRASWKEQLMQLMYKNTEILGQGLLDGDIIDQIDIPIRSRKTLQPYTNVTISVYYAQSGGSYPSFGNVAGGGYTSPVPAANALASVYGAVPAGYGTFPATIYTGSIDMSTIALNAAGVKSIPITPFKFWSSPNNPLIVQICYEMNTTSTDDQMWQTSTVSYRSCLLLAHLSNAQGAGCSFGAATGALNQKQASDLRPNLTFRYHRVYTKFPINLEYNATGATTGQWANYGNFIPANSIVEFKSTAAVTQNIDGSNITTFDELKVNTATAHVRLKKSNTIVNDTLWLTAGRLYLNPDLVTPGLLTLNNNSLGAITRTGGFLYSENLSPNYGEVNWKMGNVTGAHVFPFYTTNGPTNYIPFTYTANSGTSDLKVGTYYPSATPPSLLPWPVGVTTINSYNNPLVSDAPNMVRRFWVVTNTGAAPNADLTFTWAGSPGPETPTNGTAPSLQSQRWQGGAMTWDWPTPGQIYTPVTTVKAVNITTFNTPWVLSLTNEPLPVTLLNFTAKAERERVRLDWSTASEKNSKDFTVERTTNASEFSFIDKVDSKGSSSMLQKYFTYDNDPLNGLQYYRLTQTDLNGDSKTTDLVPVVFGTGAGNFEIVRVESNIDGSMDVHFNYDSNLPLKYRVVDKLGKLVITKDIGAPVRGLNTITLNDNLASGIYTLIIQNQETTVSRKIFR